MRKAPIQQAILALGFLLIALTLSGGSCLVPAPDGRLVWVEGWFSYPTIYLTENGSSNFSNRVDPVNGTDIKNATVTLTNVTTSTSTTAAYSAPSGASAHGSYAPTGEFRHTAGQQISLSITAKGQTVTGSKTTTPNQTYTNLSPTTGNKTRPFDISWTVPTATQPASHTWVVLAHSSDHNKSYQMVVPISQTSVQITDKHIGVGSYSIDVFGINSMTLDGARDGSFVYVGSTGAGVTGSVTVTE